jgi:hypothetical protein
MTQDFEGSAFHPTGQQNPSGPFASTATGSAAAGVTSQSTEEPASGRWAINNYPLWLLISGVLVLTGLIVCGICWRRRSSSTDAQENAVDPRSEEMGRVPLTSPASIQENPVFEESYDGADVCDLFQSEGQAGPPIEDVSSKDFLSNGGQ